MSVLSAKQFADLCGVRHQSIDKGAKTGLVVKGPDGKYDTENVVNATYIAQKRGHTGSPSTPRQSAEDREFQKAVRTRQEKKIRREDEAPDGDTVSPLDDEWKKLGDKLAAAPSLDIDKKRAQIQLMRAQRDRHQLAIAERKGELVPRDFVRRKYAALDAAMKSNFRDLPRRVSARLHAVAVAEGPAALEAALEREISEALGRVVSEARTQGLSD